MTKHWNDDVKLAWHDDGVNTAIRFNGKLIYLPRELYNELQRRQAERDQLRVAIEKGRKE